MWGVFVIVSCVCLFGWFSCTGVVLRMLWVVSPDPTLAVLFAWGWRFVRYGVLATCACPLRCALAQYFVHPGLPTIPSNHLAAMRFLRTGAVLRAIWFARFVQQSLFVIAGVPVLELNVMFLFT